MNWFKTLGITSIIILGILFLVGLGLAIDYCWFGWAR
jgi:hypothetical protein